MDIDISPKKQGNWQARSGGKCVRNSDLRSKSFSVLRGLTIAVLCELHPIAEIKLFEGKMLTQDEIDKSKQVAQAIAQRAYDEFDKMPNVFPLMMMASCGI